MTVLNLNITKATNAYKHALMKGKTTIPPESLIKLQNGHRTFTAHQKIFVKTDSCAVKKMKAIAVAQIGTKNPNANANRTTMLKRLISPLNQAAVPG
jgi:hypothetical protein